MTDEPSRGLSDEELAQQIAEELKRLKVGDILVQALYTVSSPEDQDLEEAHLAIEALRALLPVLEAARGEEAVRDFKQVTANLQLAYADAIKAGDAAPDGDGM